MGEVLYDTSVLIELQRKGVKELEGYTTILNIVEYPKALKVRGLKVIYPDARDYNLAVVVSKDLYKLGKPVPAVDLVIAAVAINRGLKLITGDRHFEYVKEVRGDLLLEVA
ncbi:MAG: PIN domain-containing protein [Thermoprotei archaeon]|nr:MAG: PIN domain-containing protein [Thermoprotei archaeon]